MKLEAMMQQYRQAANDLVEPYFVDDATLAELFNEATQEAAIRGRLIHESALPEVCNIAVLAEQAHYPLHESLYELTHVRYCRTGDSRSQTLPIKSTEELDRIVPGWRERVEDPMFSIQTDTGIKLAPTPEAGGNLYLEGYRLPLTDLEDPSESPEINAAHHRHLNQWVLHRVFSIPDSEIFDPSRAGAADLEFTRYFGARPDSDLRRMTREDEVQTVKGFFV